MLPKNQCGSHIFTVRIIPELSVLVCLLLLTLLPVSSVAQAVPPTQPAGGSPRALEAKPLTDRTYATNNELTAATFPAVFATTPAFRPANRFAANKAQVEESYGKLPLSFEANQGQADKRVRFLSRGSGYSLYLTDSAAVLTLTKQDAPAGKLARTAVLDRGPEAAGRPQKTAVVSMGLAGASRQVHVTGAGQLPGTANYFIGNDPSQWHTRVPTYARVRYSGIYPGVDLVYYGNQRRLEYDFVLAPGADPKSIRMRFAGADGLRLGTDGNLVVTAAGGALEFRKPEVCQVLDGQRTAVGGGFILLDKRTVGFRLGSYDHTKALVIDPVLTYSTFLGGSGGDRANAIAVDADGNVYVAGMTASSNFPVTPGAYQPTNHAAADNSWTAFVTKLNPSGSALIYSTYLGGSGNYYDNGDQAYGVAADASGNAYVTGVSWSSDFPVTSGAFQTKNHAAANYNSNGFVTKLDPTGTALVYSTYLGGSGHVCSGCSNGDGASALAVDSGGNAYVAGYAYSSDFPLSPGAFQTTNRAIAAGLSAPNAFVTKLNPAGTALVYSTYLGGSGANINGYGDGDSATGLAVNGSGDAYIAGYTYSSNFPVSQSAFQRENPGAGKGGENAFVTKLNSGGTALFYSTYIGGSGQDAAYALAVDGSGNAYITGQANSTDFPVTSGVFQPTNHGGAKNAFVTKLNSSGTELVYSTFIGGNDIDQANGVGVDGSGNAYIAGGTMSYDFPVTPGAFQTTNNSFFSTAFVSKLNPGGTALDYSTYLGGSSIDVALALAVDASGNAYIAGSAGSGNFPVTQGAFQTTNQTAAAGNAAGNAFVTKMNLSGATQVATTTTLSASANPAAAGAAVTFVAVVAATTGSKIPTGRVDFSVDGTASVTSTLDGTGSATWTTSIPTAGKYTVEASYESNTTFAPSNNSLSETITIPTDPSSVTATGGPVVAGGKVTLTATVSGSGPASPTGTVTFTSGTATLGVATLVSGVATLANVSATEANGLVVGGDEVTASYGGDATFLPSVGSFDLLVYSPEVPLSLSLSSSGTTAGGAGFPLAVNGANFSASSVVLWNGAVRATTYVSSTELMATILASDIAQEGTNLVTVANFEPNPGTSSALSFAVMSSNPVATISGGATSVATDGSGNHVLTLTGTDFVSNSAVEWSGTSLTTTYVSPWEISAEVTATDITTQPAKVTARNPAGSSAGFELNTIPTPIVIALSPRSATVPTGATQQFTPSVTGSANTSVTWSVNGTAGGNLTVGTISSLGLYTAPASVPIPSKVTVTATSVADPSKTAAASVTVVIPTYSLTLSTAGSGSGTITPSPVGTSCGTNCYSYASGTAVQVAESAASGSTFAGWGGACSGTGACNLTMNSNQSVSATFNLTPVVTTYHLTLSTTGSGSGTITPSPVGTSCGTNCYSYASGTAVKVAESAGSGSTFAGWGGACSGTGACNLTMNSNQSVSATFNLTPVVTTYNLTTSTTGTGTGTVAPSPVGTSCGTNCYSYASGTVVVLTATPTGSDNSVFAGWSGACSGYFCTVTMSSNLSATATFTLLTPVDGESVYQGTWIGMFSAQYQDCYQDPTTGDCDWVNGSESFNITLVMTTVEVGVDGTDVLNITEASASDPCFGSQVGLVALEVGSSAVLPNPPGSTSVPGDGLSLLFPNGSTLGTYNLTSGDVYTSLAGNVIGNSLDPSIQPNYASGPTVWVYTGGTECSDLEPPSSVTDRQYTHATWSLTKSALSASSKPASVLKGEDDQHKP